MRPTRQGLRLTPTLARAIGQIYTAEEIANITEVSEEQAAQMAEGIGRRWRKIVSDGGIELRDACEGCLAMLIESDGQFGPETSRVFAERVQPIVPAMRDFLDGLREDGRRVLTSDQYAELERKLRRDDHDLTRFENKMKRWADGGFKEGEAPRLDHFEPEDGPPLDAEQEVNHSRRLERQARRVAEYQVNRIGPDEWARFLARAKSVFEFDDEQAAKADAILAEYREKAEVIMTSDWRACMLANRMRRRAYNFIHDQPVEPLRWRLDKEYQDASRPIDELGRAFRAAVLALATEPQRRSLLAKIEETATRHGWTLERGDAELLGLAP
ncbi:MAG: hypothetical protein JXA69_09060 [Phycisphaerae bacterium]|nr:hypothetical protein [Phycisphaerae bacterium]